MSLRVEGICGDFVTRLRKEIMSDDRKVFWLSKLKGAICRSVRVHLNENIDKHGLLIIYIPR